MAGNGKGPLARIRAGSVSCAVWENQIKVNGVAKTVLKASVSRRYKDANGDWRSSESLARNEIPLAIYVLQQAFEKMILEEQTDTGSETAVEEEVVA